MVLLLAAFDLKLTIIANLICFTYNQMGINNSINNSTECIASTT